MSPHAENWRGHDAAGDTADAVLHDVFGHDEFRGGQRPVVDALQSGRDALYVAPTGEGKSLSWQLPAIMQEKGRTTLVVSPLIALMRDQIGKLDELGIPAIDLHHGQAHRRADILQRLRQGEYAMAYLSPEQVQKEDVLEVLREIRLGLLAVDEAHCISEWGDDFRPDYRRIARLQQETGIQNTLALTATAAPRVEQDIVSTLQLKDGYHAERSAPLRPNLSYGVSSVEGKDAKLARIQQLIAEYAPHDEDGVLIFTGTVRNTSRVADALKAEGMPANHYYGEMVDRMRRKREENFLADDPRVLASTNAFGMGVDKPNIRLIIHHQMPGSIQAYLHESGRAGRDGEPAHAHLLYDPSDVELQQHFLDEKVPSAFFCGAVHRVLQRAKEKPAAAERPDDSVYMNLYQLCRLYDKPKPWGIERHDTKVHAALSLLETAGAVSRPADPEVFFLEELNEERTKILETVRDMRYRIGQAHLDRMLSYITDPNPSQQALIELLQSDVTITE